MKHWTASKFKTFALQRILLRKWKEGTDGEQPFAKHVLDDFYSRYKEFSNFNEKKIAKLKRPNCWNYALPHKYECSTKAWKTIQCLSLVKYELKPQYLHMHIEYIN